MNYRRALGTLIVAGTFLVVALGAILQAPPARAKAKPGEAIVTFDDAAHAEQGPVEFSHPAHKEALGAEKLDCKPCHMKPKLFPMKRKAAREVVKMAAMAEGKACGACHDGKTKQNDKVVFGVTDEATCARCHKKK